MSRRAQRWLFWIFVAVVAFQVYVVREWLAGVLLLGVVFAGAAVLVAIALLLNTAWRAGRWAMAVAWAHLAKGFFAKAIADSNSPQ